jgi:hypothetical protein
MIARDQPPDCLDFRPGQRQCRLHGQRAQPVHDRRRWSRAGAARAPVSTRQREKSGTANNFGPRTISNKVEKGYDRCLILSSTRMPAMKPRSYILYGFEGKGGRYVVLETYSASEARDLRDARNASGFRTAVYSGGEELTLRELDQLADLEDRFT